jgi:Tfp pilus assembly protein PilN
MSVIFNSFDVIEIDGIAAGNIVDVVSNHAPRRAEVDTLESEKQELNSRIADLDTALDDEQQLTKQLQTKIADLEQYRPYNPRILKGEAFYDRVSKEDMVTLLTSEDPQLVLVGKTIDAYRDNKWPVILDSTDFQQLVGYVLASAVFNQAEVDAVMKDATREEAYT